MSIISTWMFDPDVDRPVARRLSEAIVSAGGRLIRAQPVAQPQVLLARVTDPSRWTKHAIRDPGELRHQLVDRDLLARISRDDVVVDASLGSPQEVAVRVGKALVA